MNAHMFVWAVKLRANCSMKTANTFLFWVTQELSFRPTSGRSSADWESPWHGQHLRFDRQ
jgi:hypothetical protein